MSERLERARRALRAVGPVRTERPRHARAVREPTAALRRVCVAPRALHTHRPAHRAHLRRVPPLPTRRALLHAHPALVRPCRARHAGSRGPRGPVAGVAHARAAAGLRRRVGRAQQACCLRRSLRELPSPARRAGACAKHALERAPSARPARPAVRARVARVAAAVSLCGAPGVAPRVGPARRALSLRRRARRRPKGVVGAREAGGGARRSLEGAERARFTWAAGRARGSGVARAVEGRVAERGRGAAGRAGGGDPPGAVLACSARDAAPAGAEVVAVEAPAGAAGRGACRRGLERRAAAEHAGAAVGAGGTEGAGGAGAGIGAIVASLALARVR
eukprot:851751-Rhodomonas_salina.3